LAGLRLLIGAVMVAMAIAGCGGDDNPTVPPSGSCCQANGTCTVTTQSGCAGIWAAGGVCEPNSCVQPDGACCALDGTCAVTKVAACTGTSIWMMFGVCAPNPCPPPASNYLPQTSPANVIANLQTAYAERTIDEYRKLFAEDFIFVFNPVDPVDPDHPNPPQWGLAEELSVTENMFADELVSRIELSSYSLGVPERVDSLYYGPRAWKVRVDQVNLQVSTRKLDGTLLTLLVEGATEAFFFREEPSELSPVDGRPTWYIIRWEDQPIGGMKTETTSWGQVKNLFR
jgi:hypothetical protein